MNIIPYQQRVKPSTYRRPVSTAKAEGKLAEAKKYQQKAGKYRYRAGMVSAIGGIAQSLASVTQKIFAEHEAVELMNAETETDKRQSDFFLSLNDPKNPVHYSEWTEKYAEFRTGTEEDLTEKITLPGAKREFKRWYERSANDFGTKIDTEVQRKMILEDKDAFFYNVEYWTKKGDFGKVKEYIEGARGFLITSGKADEMLLEAQENIAKITYEQFKQYAWETTYNMPYDEAVKAIMNPKNFKGLDMGDRKEIKTAIDVDEKLRKDRVKREHDIKRTDQNLELGDMYVNRTLTMKFLAEETRPDGLLSDIKDSDYTKWINMLESRPKEGVEKDKETNPDLQTDDGLFMDIMEDILAPEKDEFETNKKIAENIGADSDGNPRLSPKVAEQLTSYNKEHKDNPVFDQAVSMFTQAFKDEFLTAKELAEETDKFVLKAKSGDYTPAGLIQEAENMIALKHEEYIEDKLEKFSKKGKLFKKKETVEEWVERHPPEKKALPPLEVGNITDFMEWKNLTDRASIKTTPIGDSEAHQFNGVWYTKIGNKWYVADLENNTWNPYKRAK